MVMTIPVPNMAMVPTVRRISIDLVGGGHVCLFFYLCPVMFFPFQYFQFVSFSLF